MTDHVLKKHLKGLLSFANGHPTHHLHVVSLKKKRLIKDEEKTITIWPIENFLKALWAKQIWGSK